MIEKLDSDIQKAVVNIQGMLSDEIVHIFTDKSFFKKMNMEKFKILTSKLNHIDLMHKTEIQVLKKLVIIVFPFWYNQFYDL